MATKKLEMQEKSVYLLEQHPKLSTFSKNVIHRRPLRSAYDPSNDVEYTEFAEVTFFGSVGPFTKLRTNVQDVLVSDLFFRVAFLSVQRSNVSTFNAQSDVFVMDDGSEYKMIDFSLDAGDCVYTLQLRRKDG